MKRILAILIAATFTATAFANIKLPKIFGNDMVLQRNKPINIWGWASPNEKVTVQFNKQTKTAMATAQGKWLISLATENAGGPYQLIVKGTNEIDLKNILVGEVWVCSGQSNMEMPIEGWGKINNYQQEINAANYPMIRHIKIPNTVSQTLKEDIAGGEWKICTPANAGDFSAAAYFFARELYNKLKVPIGLINTTWGGTQVEAWTSQQAFENSADLKYVAASMKGMDIDKKMKERNENIRKSIIKLQGGFTDNVTTDNWKNIEFDDSKWPSIKVPALWENEGLPGLDGIVWMRKTVTIKAEDAGKPAQLGLSVIDDNDETFINGVKVGGTTGYNTPRNYTIAAGILKEGKNTIAVKIEDTGGGGGIYGAASAINLTIGDNIISLAGNWLFNVAVIKGGATTVGPNDYPSLLFNAMVNPLINCTIKGVIWYQGEANADRAYQYRKAFPLMITDWRKQFKQGDFPFYFVQLATFGSVEANSNNGSNWAELREAQAFALTMPNTGMAVTTDIGNPADIHPKNKQVVGKRLALIALHDLYNITGEYSSPVYQSYKVAGNSIIVSFTHTGKGLEIKGNTLVKGFEIAGADKKFVPAEAMIEGNKIKVAANGISKPVSVRYNWVNDASGGNIFNKEALPLAPFRTDNWDGITTKAKYTIVQ